MVREKKNPSSAQVSAASVKGDAGPTQHYGGGNGQVKISSIKNITWNNHNAAASRGCFHFFKIPFNTNAALAGRSAILLIK